MIQSIRLKKFRSYQDESFEFSPAVNIIVGANGSGKTNLLEAILVICQGFSYRVRDAELVMHGKDWCRLDTNSEKSDRTIKIIKQNNNFHKTLIDNGVELHRISAQRRLPVVLFEPNDLLLFHGGPESRREYMDDLIEKQSPSFGVIRRQYKRILAQRNRLLKNKPPDISSQLFVWNVRLSELGGQIASERRELVEKINEKIQIIYRSIAENIDTVEVNYCTKLTGRQYGSQLLHKLESSVQDDVERGFTSYGPHRDDLQALLNTHTLQDSASRGETRSFLLALKIIELELSKNASKQAPILLMDDVFSELDGARRRALTRLTETYQTFITTTDADMALQDFAGDCRIILVDSKD